MQHQLLAGKNGIIFGVLNEQSIAWAVAQQAKAAGAQLILTNTAAATKMGTVRQLADSIGAGFCIADATNTDDLEALYDYCVAQLGGKVDFILHAIAMSPNMRKKRAYDDLNYPDLIRTIDISALSFHRIMQVAVKKDVLNRYASLLAITFMASVRTFPDYGDMAQAKSVLESIARSFGYRLGKTHAARVNTICQGPTPSTAAKGVPGFDQLSHFSDIMSPLGNPSVEECAAYIITLFSDYTRKVTMQCLYHDGGFSAMGMSDEVTGLLAARE
ncbi:SDR family oxidoreductase [Chitinophaga sp.]|jgi:enoyl-[acyl-carrier protein] reductase I|uniref:enoyl-ACP reductase FabI n=1 Tax=Chitinophaga sp. TaxID=1869181 RepID=UPI0031D51950